jgi:membrane protein required for beta-lactamase induction
VQRKGSREKSRGGRHNNTSNKRPVKISSILALLLLLLVLVAVWLGTAIDLACPSLLALLVLLLVVTVCYGSRGLGDDSGRGGKFGLRFCEGLGLSRGESSSGS